MMNARRIAAAAVVALLAAINGCDEGTAPVGPPASITVVDGDAQQAAVGNPVPDPVVVKVVAADGRPVPSALVTFQVTAGGGSVALAAVETDVEGRAENIWTLGPTSGAHTLEARVAGDGALLVTTFSATAAAGPAAAVTPVSGNGQRGAVGSTLPQPLAVVVRDQHGNAVSGALVTYAIATGGGSIGSASVTTNASGHASTSWTLGRPLGVQTVTVTAEGGATTAFSATGTAGPVRRLIVQVRPDGGQVGTRLGTFVLRAANVYGDTVWLFDVTTQRWLVEWPFRVTVAVATGGVTGTLVKTADPSGQIDFSDLVPTGPGGTRTFQFTPWPDSIAQVVTQVPLAQNPVNFFIVSGNNQSGTVGSQLIPPVVRVTDSNGDAVPNIPVSFSSVTSNNALTGVNTVTNAAGEASPGSWTVGNPTGPARIRATMTVPGRILTVDIDASVTP